MRPSRDPDEYSRKYVKKRSGDFRAVSKSLLENARYRLKQRQMAINRGQADPSEWSVMTEEGRQAPLPDEHDEL